ncbi:hypothetical protein HK100_008773, partial [Physocladia obscura]
MEQNLNWLLGFGNKHLGHPALFDDQNRATETCLQNTPAQNSLSLPVQSQSISQKKPREKPGRRLANDEPSTKRVAQSREWQRAFRERKANYVKELEDKVANLTQIIDANGPSPAEVALSARIAALTARVAALESENANLKQGANNHPCNIMDTSNNLFGFETTLPDISGLFSTGGNSSDYLQPSPNDVNWRLKQAVSAAVVSDAETLGNTSAESLNYVDFNLLQELDQNVSTFVVPPLELPELLQTKKKDPIAIETHEKLLKLPSLQKHADLLDGLCSAFAKFSANEKEDIEPKNSISNELMEICRRKEDVLAVCSKEDREKFHQVLKETREK